jgi:mRNA-degrading endonuclease RelE of RelBE toxin-antitoxin system
MFAETQEQKTISIDDLEAALRLVTSETAFEKSRRGTEDWPTAIIGILGVIYASMCALSLVAFLVDSRLGYSMCFAAILTLLMLVMVLIRAEARLQVLKQLQTDLAARLEATRGKSPVVYIQDREVQQLVRVENEKLTRLVQVGIKSLSEKEATWYSVAILPDVIDSLQQLRESEREGYDAVKDVIDSLQSNPYPSSARLIDSPNKWEVSVDRYLITYLVDDVHKRLEIIESNRASGGGVNHAT